MRSAVIRLVPFLIGLWLMAFPPALPGAMSVPIVPPGPGLSVAWAQEDDDSQGDSDAQGEDDQDEDEGDDEQ